MQRAAGEEGLIQDQAITQLRAMLQDGRIRPGQRIYESGVAKAFGISRSPARYALAALAEMKLLEPCEGRGYVPAGTVPLRGAKSPLKGVELSSAAGWERIYGVLEQQITDQVLHHSIRVTEERLADHFGVGRTVARDALTRLHSAGVIDKDRQGRWFADRVTAKRIRDMYHVRALLEPSALLLSADSLDYDEVALLLAKLRKRTAGKVRLDSEGHFDLEKDFHIRLLARCPNDELLKALERAHLFLSCHAMFDLGFSAQQVKGALKDHENVLTLLLEGRIAEASQALRVHLESSCEVWVRRFEKIGAQAGPQVPDFIVLADT